MSTSKNNATGKETELTRISEKETFEFLKEGLRQAASAAAELADVQSHPIWLDISRLLDEMHNNAVSLYRSKPLSRSDVLSMLSVREKNMLNALDEKRPSKFIIN